MIRRYAIIEHDLYQPTKEPLWVDDTPIRPKPSPLIMLLLSQVL